MVGAIKRRLSHSKSRPSSPQASSACGSTLSCTDPAVPQPSEGDVNTHATKANTIDINLTKTPSASATEAKGTRNSTNLAPAPHVAGRLEILGPVEVLGQPGGLGPSESGCVERQVLVPQIAISGPDEDNGNGK